jgi:hypothetical protein
MKIDHDYLRKEIEGLRAQQAQHLNIYQQISGAIVAHETMLNRLEAPEPTNEPEPEIASQPVATEFPIEENHDENQA